MRLLPSALLYAKQMLAVVFPLRWNVIAWQLLINTGKEVLLTNLVILLQGYFIDAKIVGAEYIQTSSLSWIVKRWMCLNCSKITANGSGIAEVRA